MDNYQEMLFTWEKQYKLFIKVLTEEFLLSINQIDLLWADSNYIFFSFLILDVVINITNL